LRESKPDLAIFLPNLEAGGVERSSIRLANYFADWGMQVDMLLIQERGALISELSPKVRLINLGCLSEFSSLPGLICYLRRRRPAAFLSSLPLTNWLTVIAAQLAHVKGTRIALRQASTLSQQERPTRWKKWLERRLVKILYPKASMIIAVSFGVAGDLVSYAGIPEKKICVIPDPVISEELLQKARESVNLQCIRSMPDHFGNWAIGSR